MSLKQPVRYPVKHYSHLDVGAPQLADADGVIKTILKACLITGIGDKAGAGWTALFEDDFRIVLRTPLRTGNPPDIKIENGIINGTARHRIVSQDNPTGLDDATELASVNLLARDNRFGNQWHLIASDFAFVLCYQMGESSSGDRNFLMFVGEMQKLSNTGVSGFFASSSAKVGVNGTASSYIRTIMSNNAVAGDYHGFVDLRTNNLEMAEKSYLTLNISEKQIGNDYFVQTAIFSNAFILPFFVSITGAFDDKLTKEVVIDGRPMLRYVNSIAIDNVGFTRDIRALFIPLDYWEL